MEGTKFCPICKEIKPLSGFTLNPDGSVRKHVCKLCYGRRWGAQIKLEMLEALGWKCACCGEDNPQFLQLDHINNDGAEHRSKYESSNHRLIWADAKREGWPRDKYQLLCGNCNYAKEYYDGCPHKTGLTTEKVLANLRSKLFATGKSLQNYKDNKGLIMGRTTHHVRVISNTTKEEKMRELEELLNSMSPDTATKILSSLLKT